MERLTRVLQLPKRGRYGQKHLSARRQCINRHAASQSSQRETLRKGHLHCVVRALAIQPIKYYRPTRTMQNGFIARK